MCQTLVLPVYDYVHHNEHNPVAHGSTDHKQSPYDHDFEVHKPDLFQLIENSGGVVAADDLCIGTRYFFDQIDESISDPIEAIAKRYLELIPCSRMFDFHEGRIDHAVKLITDYDIQGLIYVVLKYCDDFMIDYPLYKEKMDELGIPILYLEREYILDNVEALRTRIEAFIELIGGK